MVKKDSESTQITKLFSLCCHWTGQDICAAEADAGADKYDRDGGEKLEEMWDVLQTAAPLHNLVNSTRCGL